jgi:hypothetical protein
MDLSVMPATAPFNFENFKKENRRWGMIHLFVSDIVHWFGQ